MRFSQMVVYETIKKSDAAQSPGGESQFSEGIRNDFREFILYLQLFQYGPPRISRRP
jgi:hypothetical protein